MTRALQLAATKDGDAALGRESPRRPVSPKAFFPREHGAYAQLVLPLGAALAASRPSIAGICLATASFAAFVAHEPVLVVLGHRGGRARRQAGTAASRFLVAALGVAVALAAAAFVLSPQARPWMALAAALAAMSAAGVLARKEKTLWGQLLVCAALTSTAIPTAVCGGMGSRDAAALAVTFFAGFALSAVEVRRIARRDASQLPRAAVWATTFGLVLGLAVYWPRLSLAALPLLCAVVFIAFSRPTAAKLRRVGWCLVTASVATAAFVVLAVRS